MAYTPRTWNTGDLITAAELNTLEQGVAAAASAGGGVNAADTGFDLVLLLGQSNMVGQNTDFDARTDPPDPRVYTYDFTGTYAARIASAVDPLNHQNTGTGVGPGLPFARWYAAATPVNRRVLLVAAAYSGTPLVPTSGTTWNPDVRGANYDHAVTQARAALAAAGANSRIVAALWVQGESDSGAAAADYRTALDNLIGQLRADLALPSLPFVLGGMSPEGIAAVGAARQVIADVHAATPARVNYTAYVPGPTGVTQGDNLHYTAAGQRIQGRALAAAYRTALVNTAPPAAPTRTPIPPPPPPITSVADTFDRANSTTTLGVTSTGAVPWQAVTGTWGISGNQAYNAGGTGGALAAVDITSANHTAQVRVAASDAGSGLVARLTDANNWVMLLAPAGGQISVYHNVGGSVSAIDYPTTTTVAGDIVKLTCSGGTISYYVNGTLAGSVADSSTGTRCGLRADTNGARFDDFAAAAL